jgi:hypothetical protein
MEQVSDAAGGAYVNSYVYDGPTSSTSLDSDKFPGAASGEVKTVGQWFEVFGGREALSQVNGLAIFIREADWQPSWLFGNGSFYSDTGPTPYALGTLMHEILHKQMVGGGFTHEQINHALFGENRPQLGLRNNISQGLTRCF